MILHLEARGLVVANGFQRLFHSLLQIIMMLTAMFLVGSFESFNQMLRFAKMPALYRVFHTMLEPLFLA